MGIGATRWQAGLKAALDGEGVAAAPTAAPTATPAQIAAPQPAAERQRFGVEQAINYGSTVVASLLPWYGLSAGKCSPLAALSARELWLMRIGPVPPSAVERGF